MLQSRIDGSFCSRFRMECSQRLWSARLVAPESLVRLGGYVGAGDGSDRFFQTAPPPEDGLWFGRRSRLVPSVLTAGFGCNLSGAGPWIRRSRV